MKQLSLVFLLLSIGLVSHAQYDPKALEVLDAMSAKYKSIPAFKANITSSLLNEGEGINEEFGGEITVRGDMYRLKMDEQLVINDAVTVWTYLPDVNEVNIDNYDPDEDGITPSKIYDAYKEGYKYLYLQDEKEGGVLCSVVDLVPNDLDAQFFKIRMRISKADYTLQSWTMFEKSGNEYKYSISNFDPTITVSDDFFKFDPGKYPGVEIIDLR